MYDKQTNKQTKHIFFACDLNYAPYLITTIKSICYHHQNVQFYLLNKEIPIEYFDNLNQKLAQLGSQISDFKLDAEVLQKAKHTHNSLTEACYYRLLIPELLPNVDKALYLDSDTIADGNLDELFALNLDDYLLAAAKDVALNCGEHWYGEFPPDMKPYFNSGVLLLNCRKIRETDLVARAVELQQTRYFVYDDQDILNILTRNQWLMLDYRYNHQASWEVGVRNRIHDFKRERDLDLAVDMDAIRQEHAASPKIIHYINVIKPWRINDVPFRARYWFYHDLEWAEIRAQHENN
ncbi:MAG: glycosyltransferase family 8 protein [Neisseria sp.]|nr:glycosyltransferase family 8 protein [Neisseria sp.]